MGNCNSFLLKIQYNKFRTGFISLLHIAILNDHRLTE